MQTKKVLCAINVTRGKLLLGYFFERFAYNNFGMFIHFSVHGYSHGIFAAKNILLKGVEMHVKNCYEYLAW